MGSENPNVVTPGGGSEHHMGKCPDCGGPVGPEHLVYHHVDCPEVTMWLLRGGEIARDRLARYPDSQFVVWGQYRDERPWFSCPQMAAEWALEWMESVLHKNNGG